MSTADLAPEQTERQLLFDITSETDPLQEVIVHTPGAEIELVLPENRLELLFDDILFVGAARQEHEIMCDVFRKTVSRPASVLQIADLLREAFRLEDARLDFVDDVCRIYQDRNLHSFADDLARLDPSELHDFALTGRSSLPINMQPLPNLIFTRDVAAVVHDHIILSHAATAVRRRESVILRIVLEHHPIFSGSRGKIIVLPMGVTFEGGDLLVAGPECIVVGNSERTSFTGVMSLAQELFARTSIEHVVMVDLPKARYCMHLDTVFTFASPDECVVFPPIIDEDTLGNVIHYTRSDRPDKFLSEVRTGLKLLLEDVLGRPLSFIACGGDDPLSQRREQWTDGANLFAVAPGVVIGYERNENTFAALRDCGYRIVTADGFLSYFEESEFKADEKLAIKLEGNELSRGRGGPRCMTLPLARRSS